MRRTVLDDECLAQPLLQFVPNRARDQIGAATRNERHQDRHAVRRIILSSRVTLPCGERDDTDDDPTQYDIHRLPIWSARVAHLARRGARFGVVTGKVTTDMGTVRQRKRDMVNREIAAHLQNYKATGAELAKALKCAVAQSGKLGRPKLDNTTERKVRKQLAKARITQGSIRCILQDAEGTGAEFHRVYETPATEVCHESQRRDAQGRRLGQSGYPCHRTREIDV